MTLTTVTAKYLGPDDTPAGGTVEFQLSASVYDSDDAAIRPQVKVTRTLDGSGALTVDLMPGADPGVTLTGTLTYRVVERIIGAPHRTYFVEVPVGVGPVDLGTLAPQGTPTPANLGVPVYVGPTPPTDLAAVWVDTN